MSDYLEQRDVAPAKWFSPWQLTALGISVLLTVGHQSAQVSAADVPAARPNIVLILCDDMGWSDIGCYGGEIETPHLDRLAAEGLRFTQFYNNAKCTTTRASLLTGLYPRGVVDGDAQLLRTNMLTLGEALQLAGYRTALMGKWHLGRSDTRHPRARGFDQFYGLLDGACNFFDPSIVDPPYKGSRTRYFARNDERITDFPDDFYTTDAFTDQAIRTLREFSASDEPFFLHVCYTAPHYPLHAWPEDIEKYRGRYLDGWDALRRQRFARQREMGLLPADVQLSGRDSRAYDWDSANHEFEDLRMAVYAAMVDRMDQNIGRLLAALEESGAADNTLILFLSDNGGCAEEPGGRDPAKRRPGPRDDYVAVGPAWGWAQNAPFRRYKVWMHEGGVCTPLIAHWPGVVPAGEITNQVGHIVDFMPTLLDAAGHDYPSEHNGEQLLPLEGSSLMPVLVGGRRAPPERMAWSYNGNAAIREGDRKLVWDKLVKAWELYDVSQDRTEMHNLAEREPETVRRLATNYNAWARETGNREHPVPQESTSWRRLSDDGEFTAWRENGHRWVVGGDAELGEGRRLDPQPGSGVLMSVGHECGNLVTRDTFQDVEVELEFLIARNSNSGVKLNGLYEIQLYDSADVEELRGDHCGGIYPRGEHQPRYHTIDEGTPPRVNAARPAGEWQTLHIAFQSPRFDEEGHKTSKACFRRVVLNGVVIHEDVELEYPTGAAWRLSKEVPRGPLFLQGDHGPVAFRNIRVRPLPAEGGE